MTAATLMIQGTGSHVGKSILTAALCRILKQDGYKVAPFKAQNMALNSYVTDTGEEIGTAQAAQAEACGIRPTAHMNPILLKPNSDVGSQVIVRGRSIGNMSVEEYLVFKKEGRGIALESLNRLRQEYDVVIMEGAGSPAEINLRENDIANMGIASLSDSPVLLVGDIDRGGVFAWISGTMDLLNPSERARVKGFLINKFRGRQSLLEPAITDLEERTSKKVLGVLPYLTDLRVPQEDSVALADLPIHKTPPDADIDIAVIKLPRISNFSDFDPFCVEKDVSIRYVSTPEQLGKPDVIILPGSKSSLADTLFLEKSGLARLILQLLPNGCMVVGICGGFQMLGQKIIDSGERESAIPEVQGLGLLPMITEIMEEKKTFQIQGVVKETGIEVTGYEIHMGESKGDGPPLFTITRKGNPDTIHDGMRNQSGTVWGTYIHGLFDNDSFRRSFINTVRKRKGIPSLDISVPFERGSDFDRLAQCMRENVAMKNIYAILFEEAEK